MTHFNDYFELINSYHGLKISEIVNKGQEYRIESKLDSSDQVKFNFMTDHQFFLDIENECKVLEKENKNNANQFVQGISNYSQKQFEIALDVKIYKVKKQICLNSSSLEQLWRTIDSPEQTVVHCATIFPYNDLISRDDQKINTKQFSAGGIQLELNDPNLFQKCSFNNDDNVNGFNAPNYWIFVIQWRKEVMI